MNHDQKNCDSYYQPFKNAFAVADPLVLKKLNTPVSMFEAIEDDNILIKFLEEYQNWILSTKNNEVKGLEDFPYACFTNGTTEAFDKFYAKHSTRRFRFFKGEFVYHQLSCRNNVYNWAYIEEDILKKNDVVIISLPFSDTGMKHNNLDCVLQYCSELDIPVLLDCAYFGVCGDLEFNFKYPCIKEITFSLSKTFYSAYLRIGMRLTRQDDDDPLFVTNKMGYINKPSAYMGLKLLQSFGPDYIYNKYRKRQLEYCQILKLEPSRCVLFGIGDKRWNDYNRGREFNRLSLHKFLATKCHDKVRNEKRQIN